MERRTMVDLGIPPNFLHFSTAKWATDKLLLSWLQISIRPSPPSAFFHLCSSASPFFVEQQNVCGRLKKRKGPIHLICLMDRIPNSIHTPPKFKWFIYESQCCGKLTTDATLLAYYYGPGFIGSKDRTLSPPRLSPKEFLGRTDGLEQCHQN